MVNEKMELEPEIRLIFEESNQTYGAQRITAELRNRGYKTSKNTYYLCVIIDLFSRKVISYSIGKNNSSQLVNTTLKKAYENRNPKDELIFHSDVGSNYTSKSFAKLLTDYNVHHSFSKAGTPYDNSVTESFFATFRRECYYRYNFYSYNDLIEIISEYIEKYNKIRIHSYLNY